MARPRSFDEHAVIAAASSVFTTFGYEATSVDDLLRATGLHRGSLYQAFGSKRGIFLAALRAQLSSLTGHDASANSSASEDADRSVAPAPDLGISSSDDAMTLDLILVATLELAPRDEEIRALVGHALEQRAGSGQAALILGHRLLARAHINPASRS